ncbi:unnamed protein product [Phytophthora fragariaefolia]|uniref:Unnamed protein product n=1 Tax=Phytophthora fragariaefolia TaxID=1490495 RepID=A0A9W6U353_9STRA|nr:unnamed protein product [Phytophthora fragariaefolia]
MNGVLCPPNSHWLSDEVIGAVRCKPPARGHFGERDGTSNRGPVHYKNNVLLTTSPPTRERSTPWAYQCEGTAPAPASTVAFPNAPNDSNVSPRPSSKRPRPIHKVLHEPSADKTTDEDALNLLRERRRLTQIRYRQKLRNHADTLEEEVKILRKEVYQLEKQHQSISPRSIATTTPWSVVTDYFRLFRYALTAYVPVSERSISQSSRMVYESDVHQEFLQATMAPDVVIDTGRGIDAVLDHWRLISRSQPKFEIQAARLENGPGGSIVAATRSNIVLCESMLRCVFPKLAESDRGRALAAKLLGQQMQIDGSTVFCWDDEIGRVVSIDGQCDILTPMLRLLGNLEDLEFVFEGALMSLDGRLKARKSF